MDFKNFNESRGYLSMKKIQKFAQRLRDNVFRRLEVQRRNYEISWPEGIAITCDSYAPVFSQTRSDRHIRRYSM